MNFDDCVKAHVAWKGKLQSYLKKPDKSLSPTTVESDRNCDLGKWLHGEGAKFASNPKFSQLVAEHAKFHKAAAGVIRHADTGKNVVEETALGGNSEFSTASAKVVGLIMECKKEFSK
jgi:hypothetical protein